MFIEIPKQFTIKRSDWSRGETYATRLLDDFGRYDCIGFLFKCAGIPDKELLNQSEPVDIATKHELNCGLVRNQGNGYTQTLLCSEIIKTNDAVSCIDREQKLIDLFAGIDIALAFED